MARRLVADGFRVVIDPDFWELPAEVVRLRPRILAVRDGERRIVEIVGDGTREEGDRVARLAAALDGEPGWRLETVSSDAEGNAPPPWPREGVERRVAEGEALLPGHPEAALVLLWAATEAAGRLLAEGEGVELQRWEPMSLFTQLVHEGLMDQADLDRVRRASRTRNAVAHGLEAPAPAGEMAAEVAGVARRLLAEALAPGDVPAVG